MLDARPEPGESLLMNNDEIGTQARSILVPHPVSQKVVATDVTETWRLPRWWRLFRTKDQNIVAEIMKIATEITEIEQHNDTSFHTPPNFSAILSSCKQLLHQCHVMQMSYIRMSIALLNVFTP